MRHYSKTVLQHASMKIATVSVSIESSDYLISSGLAYLAMVIVGTILFCQFRKSFAAVTFRLLLLF